MREVCVNGDRIKVGGGHRAHSAEMLAVEILKYCKSLAGSISGPYPQGGPPRERTINDVPPPTLIQSLIFSFPPLLEMSKRMRLPCLTMQPTVPDLPGNRYRSTTQPTRFGRVCS